MSFLDNLENSLNSLERSPEQDREDARKEAADREARLANDRAAAPFVEELKKGKWAHEFLNQCVAIGHGQRTRINMVWLQSILRLDAKEKRLELQPSPSGVTAVFFVDGEETLREPLDLSTDPAAYAQRWLS